MKEKLSKDGYCALGTERRIDGSPKRRKHRKKKIFKTYNTATIGNKKLKLMMLNLLKY